MRILVLEMSTSAEQVTVGAEGLRQLRALASESRLRILEHLARGDLNIQELSEALGMPQPNVSKHIQILSDAGFVTFEHTPGVQGIQKRCHLAIRRFAVDLAGQVEEVDQAVSLTMPVGLYSEVEPKPTCGLAGAQGFIGYLDDPLAFYFPERAQAKVLWMAAGFVEYVFPNTLPQSVRIHRLDLSFEVSSETPGYNDDFPSDITVWINEVEIGTWRSPGDMGSQRGRLNPSWWRDDMNQYGFLKVFCVDERGTSIDGVLASNVTLAALEVRPWQPTRVRIGIKPNAENPGGFTLFGSGFGNYDEDITLRLHYVDRRSAP